MFFIFKNLVIILQYGVLLKRAHMPQQVNLFSGTSFQGLSTPFHLPKSIDWKVAGCFSLVAGCLIFLALRMMRPASNNSLSHSTSESSNLAGRVSQHEAPKSKSPEGQSAKETPSPTPAAKPSADVPQAVASQEVALSQTTGKDGWTVSTVNGEVTASFSMNSIDIIDVTKQFVTEKGGTIPSVDFGFRRWLKSEIFTLDGEEYCLSLRQNEDHIDEMRFSLEKVSELKKAGHSFVNLKCLYKIGDNDPQAGIKLLDFSKEKSQPILTPRRWMRVAKGQIVTFTVSFLKPNAA